MLGMSRKEINKKFDDIVEFAEIEKFIDTPVKFYSSGMYVRLAFAVAAHLDPDILILDEVLSVGDAAFQKKSLAKIKSTMEAGTTVLYVSHSMDSVKQLCSRGILMSNGHIVAMGSTDSITYRYNKLMSNPEPEKELQNNWSNTEALDNEYFIPKSMKLLNESSLNNIDKWVEIKGRVKKKDELLHIGFALYNSNKSLLFITYPTDYDDSIVLNEGNVTLKAKIPKHLLNEGTYTIELVGGLHNKMWLFEPQTTNPSINFSVEKGLSSSKYWKHAREGYLAPVIEWGVD